MASLQSGKPQRRCGPSSALVKVFVEAGYHGAGHVGGVYVRPEDRGRGMGRRLLVHLLAHGRTTGQLLRPIFIVRVENQPARRFFESLSCAAVGRFGFLLGGWTGTQPN